MKWSQIFLDFTNVCNYRCLFCNSYTYKPVVLRLKDFVDFESLIQKADIIDVTGYEELTTHPDFIEIVNQLTFFEKPFSLVTNGSLLTQDKMKALLKSSIYLLNFSINSLDPVTYKFLSGGIGNLDRTLENIQEFYAKDTNFIRQFSFVINAHNFNELFNFVDYVVKYKDNNKTRIVFRGLTPTLKYPEGFSVKDTEENRSFLTKANQYAKSKGLELETFSFDMNRNEEGQVYDEEKLCKVVKTCGVLNSVIFVGPNGNVLPCCWVSESMGNIKDESIENIWVGKSYTDLRNSIQEGDYNKYCKNCRRAG